MMVFVHDRVHEEIACGRGGRRGKAGEVVRSWCGACARRCLVSCACAFNRAKASSSSWCILLLEKPRQLPVKALWQKAAVTGVCGLLSRWWEMFFGFVCSTAAFVKMQPPTVIRDIREYSHTQGQLRTICGCQTSVS